jgi:glycosyltransferase involved in cell wall biosynthesis
MARTIFYITPSVQLLGARVSLVELLTHLDKSRFRPVVVCPKDGPLPQRLAELGIETRIVRFGNWRKIKYWPLIPIALYNLFELAREEKVSLWHSNEFWAFPYAYLTSRRLKIPTICHFRCSRLPSQLPPKKIMKYYVHKANRIIAVSNSQRIIFKDIPEALAKFMVIPNGVNMNKFNQTDPSLFRRDIGMNGNEFLVGMVGPVSEHKGVEEFLIAASKAVAKLPNIRFAIVGPDKPPAFTSRMKKLAAELNISDRVVFTGFRDDIPNVMSSLDLMVTPSRVEAFGRVLLEAMATGIPIIASRVGGIPEIISSPDVGVLVAPQQPEPIADAIIDLLNNPSRRRHIIDQARNRAASLYSIEMHAAKIQDVYEQVLGEHGMTA